MIWLFMAALRCGESEGNGQGEGFNQTLAVQHVWGEDPVSTLIAHPKLALAIVLLLLAFLYMWKGIARQCTQGKGRK